MVDYLIHGILVFNHVGSWCLRRPMTACPHHRVLTFDCSECVVQGFRISDNILFNCSTFLCSCYNCMHDDEHCFTVFPNLIIYPPSTPPSSAKPYPGVMKDPDPFNIFSPPLNGRTKIYGQSYPVETLTSMC
jgi:hypothetical protein